MSEDFFTTFFLVSESSLDATSFLSFFTTSSLTDVFTFGEGEFESLELVRL